jgi:hypothetical protein
MTQLDRVGQLDAIALPAAQLAARHWKLPPRNPTE